MQTERYVRIIATLSLTSVLLLLVSALGTRFGWWIFSVGIGLSLLSLMLAKLTLLLAIILAGLTWYRSNLSAHLKALIFFSMPALLVALLVGRLVLIAGALPAIHNISTDTVDPVQFSETIKAIRSAPEINPLAYEGVADLQRQAYPNIVPIVSDLPPDEAFQKALDLVGTLGWRLVTANPREGTIEATETSFWFGFKDDVAIRIRRDVVGSRIDLRSVSRVGKADFGKNAQRIALFASRWQG